MANGEKVPERPQSTGPAIWLIRNDASARRLRLVRGELRTTIGFDTIVSRHVDRIVLDDVTRLDVLAPYTAPVPKLALIIVGLSIGMAIGSQFHPGSALILAFVTITFGLVAGLVGSMSSASQRIARLRMRNDTAYTIAYRIEDEDDVRRLLGEERWNDENNEENATPLHPDEERLAERMRYGALLAAGSLCIIALMAVITYDPDLSDMVAIPVNILYLAVLALALMFSGIAWYKMARASIRK